MKAVKDNKEYNITEELVKTYQDAGFDIKDDNGKTVAYGRGKTVPYGDYAKLKEENDILKAELETLKSRETPKGSQPKKSGE